MSVLRPATIDALVEAVRATSPAPLSIAGAGTTRPWPANHAASETLLLDTRALTGISAYDPAECVVTVLAGTPVQQVAETLATHRQYLPWDPPFVRAGATIGGMIASGLSGPGRHRYGGVRDFVIGARVVDGHGRLIASGGQVVKNAAGFLMHHALVGSAGRLGVIAEVSVKVFPRPEATCTLVAPAPSQAEALAAHERLRLANLDLDALDLDADTATVYARLAGAADALDARAQRAARALGHAVVPTTGDEEARTWAAQALDAWPLRGTTVKVPSTPSRLAATLETLAPLGACRASVGGAVVYLHSEHPLASIDVALSARGLAGAVVRGAGCGTRIGVVQAPAFHDRVLRTLDPNARFR